MKVLDLCSGIGGFSLAAHWMGWETIAFCERDAFCQKVLVKNFPGVPIYDDLTTLNARPFRGTVDLLTAGYPCQPFSQAGRRLGEKDPRHLWPHVRRIINQSRPTWVVCENVAGHISMGIDKVCAQMEALAYTVQPLVIPACATGAPHRRDRVWIIARRGVGSNATSAGTCTDNARLRARLSGVNGRQISITPDSHITRTQGRTQARNVSDNGAQSNDEHIRRCKIASPGYAESDRLQERIRQNGESFRRSQSESRMDAIGASQPDWYGGDFGQPSPLTHWRTLTHSKSERCRNGNDSELQRQTPRKKHTSTSANSDKNRMGIHREEWEAFGAVCDVDDGIPARLVRDRVNKLKALGNTIVPQVVFEIFKAIDAAQKG